MGPGAGLDRPIAPMPLRILAHSLLCRTSVSQENPPESLSSWSQHSNLAAGVCPGVG
jgi:hypothetical protein